MVSGNGGRSSILINNQWLFLIKMCRASWLVYHLMMQQQHRYFKKQQQQLLSSGCERFPLLWLVFAPAACSVSLSVVLIIFPIFVPASLPTFLPALLPKKPPASSPRPPRPNSLSKSLPKSWPICSPTCPPTSLPAAAHCWPDWALPAALRVAKAISPTSFAIEWERADNAAIQLAHYELLASSVQKLFWVLTIPR